MKEGRSQQTEHIPFKDDPAYLQAEFAWLNIRARRIAAERTLRDGVRDEQDGRDGRPGSVGSRELRRILEALKRQESEARDVIDARLILQRGNPAALELGLDEICDEHGLGDQERTILLALCIPAIGQCVAEEVLGDLISCYGSLTVEDLIRLLGPAGVADWLSYRSFFRPDGKLVQAGLISLVLSGEPTAPDTYISADVQLTIPAFTRLVGDEQILFETELPELGDSLAGEGVDR